MSSRDDHPSSKRRLWRRAEGWCRCAKNSTWTRRTGDLTLTIIPDDRGNYWWKVVRSARKYQYGGPCSLMASFEAADQTAAEMLS